MLYDFVFQRRAKFLPALLTIVNPYDQKKVKNRVSRPTMKNVPEPLFYRTETGAISPTFLSA
jgi:hypothetical protein